MTTTLYDADGEVTETIDALGPTTTSLYDADGRLLGETWDDAHGKEKVGVRPFCSTKTELTPVSFLPEVFLDEGESRCQTILFDEN
jgi:YD repeat-containing protein